MNRNKYYITFTYSCANTVNLFANFYFDSKENPDISSQNNFIPSQYYSNRTLSGNLETGENITFINNNVFIDVDEFFKTRFYNNEYNDLIIELHIIDKYTNNLESTLATYCKIYVDKNIGEYKLRVDHQKLKLGNQWFALQDVYGLNTDSNECEICCTNTRNSIFLPCKHSYACKECAVMLRMRGNNCPICRIRNIIIILAISDSMVLDIEINNS